MAEPAEWKEKVERSLPDARLFRRLAKQFEKLDLNGKKRRAGFKAYAAHALPEGDFPAVWRMEAVKVALVAMSNGFCAYCQACVEDNSYGPVEHFRPKALFPTLAYEIGNYFFGCEQCNQKKRDRWPKRGAYVRPDEGDPAARFVFDERGRMRAARAEDADAKATIRDFKLNRKALRKQRRIEIRERLKMLRSMLEVPGLPEEVRRDLAKGYLRERLTRFSEAINQNVRQTYYEVCATLLLG